MEHQGSEPGTPEDGSEKVMVEVPLTPGGQNYPLKVGSEWIRNTARERKTKSHNVRIAKILLVKMYCTSQGLLNEGSSGSVGGPTAAHSVRCDDR